MEEKILSVIVPSYNMEQYLPKCLGSLVACEMKNKLEILVVNDGSKDETSAIAHDFETKYRGVVKVIDKKNGHYGSCINAALGVCTGEYVKVLDADDYVNSDGLDTFLKGILALKNEPDLLITNFAMVDRKGCVLREVIYNAEAGVVFPMDELLSLEAFMGEFHMHAIAYKRTVFENYRQTEGIAYTDNEWTFVPMQNVRKWAFIDCSLYRYLIDREGQSIDESITLRDAKMFDTVYIRLLSEYEHHYASLPEANQLYWNQFLKWFTPRIYGKYLLRLPLSNIRSDFLKIDEKLKVLSPEVYSHVASCFKLFVRSPLAFSYLTPLRKSYFCGIFLLKFVRFYFAFRKKLA